MPGRKIYLKQKLGKAISTHMTIDYQTKDINQSFGDFFFFIWRFKKKYNIPRDILKDTFSPRCPSKDEWIKKPWYIHTLDYYSAIKRNTFELVLMRWLNLQPIIQSEVS